MVIQRLMRNPCPRCGRDRVSDLIGHRHTGKQCFWCGFNEDRALQSSEVPANG